MRLNRRNVLVGLGTIVAGGGGALATGAFSSVEATRDVSIDTTGDGSALLALDLDDALDGGSNQIKIDVSQLNENATTTFKEALLVTNNGSDGVGLSVTGAPSYLTIETDSVDLTAGNTIDLGPTGSTAPSDSVNLHITFETGTESNTADQITIKADTADYSG